MYTNTNRQNKLPVMASRCSELQQARLTDNRVVIPCTSQLRDREQLA